MIGKLFRDSLFAGWVLQPRFFEFVYFWVFLSDKMCHSQKVVFFIAKLFCLCFCFVPLNEVMFIYFVLFLYEYCYSSILCFLLFLLLMCVQLFSFFLFVFRAFFKVCAYTCLSVFLSWGIFFIWFLLSFETYLMSSETLYKDLDFLL